MTDLLGAKAVALATGVSTDTLRYYERKGLLPRVHRTAAGHRRYSSATIERVLLIQRALVVGFSLADLSRVLSLRDRGGAPCHSVRTLVGERLEALERQMEDLVVLRDELRTLVAEWDSVLARTPAGKPARLLDRLATRPAVERARRKRHERVEQARLPRERSGRLPKLYRD
jgi:DNA-binding transcriptional MerR regulator